MGYFFDTYAIIEIIKENESYQKFFGEEIVTSILNVGELYYALLKDFSESLAEEWKNSLEKSSLLIDMDVIISAVKFRFKNKDKHLSFVDCVGYTLAKENNLIFLTGNEAFKGLENVEFVK